MTAPPSKPPRLKPLAAQVSMMGEHGEPDLHLGEVTLHPTLHDAGLVWLSGVLIHRGRPLATLNINGAPLAAFPTSTPPGRPPATAKHKAVLLSWHINLEREGKKGRADEITSERFDYSEPKKVRDIRQGYVETPEKLVFRMDEQGQPGYAALIEKPTFYLKDGSLEILGLAWSWGESWGRDEAGYGAVRFTSKLENTDTAALKALQEAGGPIIIIAF